MKYIFILFLVLRIPGAFAQDSETVKLTEALVGKIIPTEYAYFNLVDSGLADGYAKLYFDPAEFKTFYQENPDFDPQEMITESGNVQPISWRNYQIPKAHIYAVGKVPFKSNNSFVRTVVVHNAETPDSTLATLRQQSALSQIHIRKDAKWSKQKQKEAVEQEESRLANQIPNEEKKYYQITSPIFSKNKDYAIIGARSQREGDFFIFKRNNGVWKCLKQFGHTYFD